MFKILLFTNGVEGIAALGFLSSSQTSLATFRIDLLNSSMFYLGGYLTNIPLLTLAALGIIKARERSLPNLIFWSLLAATSIVYLIGGIIVKSRLLYNLPIGVFAAIGVSYIDELVENVKLRTVIKAVIVVLLLSFLFRDLANLV